MIEQILEFLERAGIGISLFAVLIIVAGFIYASWGYARRFGHSLQADNFNVFKGHLGSALLLGLEILVLAAVINTITVTPDFQSLIVLMAVVVVRTIVSWNLTLSTRGHWPWQKSVEDTRDA